MPSEILSMLRKKRGFTVERYCETKTDAINDFFRSDHLDSVVIGLSGGIDSAVALALLVGAAQKAGSPIRKIVGLSLPIYGDGSTDQNGAVARARLLKDRFESCAAFEFNVRNLTESYEGYINAYGLGDNDAFSDGQLLSIVRTPYLYFNAAILQTKGYASIVCGTTNRDEGAYIGFFGKASDAMVDFQPIADIHKSEVYQVAEFYRLPQAIIDEQPKGDVYDGRTDVEMIGAPYDDVELFALLRDYGGLPDTSFMAIEAIHKKNEHKYKVGMPSRFVDVMPRAVAGGWS